MSSLRWMVVAAALVVSGAAKAQGGGIFADVSVGFAGGYSTLLGEPLPIYGVSLRSGTNFMTSYTGGIAAIFGLDFHFPTPMLFGAGLGYTLFPFGEWLMFRGGAMIFGYATISYQLAIGPELEAQIQPLDWPIGIFVRGGGMIGIVGNEALIGRATVGIVWKQG